MKKIFSITERIILLLSVACCSVLGFGYLSILIHTALALEPFLMQILLASLFVALIFREQKIHLLFQFIFFAYSISGFIELFFTFYMGELRIATALSPCAHMVSGFVLCMLYQHRVGGTLFRILIISYLTLSGLSFLTAATVSALLNLIPFWSVSWIVWKRYGDADS